MYRRTTAIRKCNPCQNSTPRLSCVGRLWEEGERSPTPLRAWMCRLRDDHYPNLFKIGTIRRANGLCADAWSTRL